MSDVELDSFVCFNCGEEGPDEAFVECAACHKLYCDDCFCGSIEEEAFCETCIIAAARQLDGAPFA